MIDIYHKIALTFEEESNYSINEALEYYERCLSVAQMASEKEAEGSICNKIGTLYFNMGEIGKSIDYQKRYLEIAKEYNNDAGRQKQMESYSGLAKAFLKIEKIEEAQEYLELFYSIAKELRMNNAQSEAALLLANLNSKKKNTSKSLEFYQLHFDAARTEKPENKSRKLIDKARVTLGIAKSNSNIGNFLKWIEKSNDNMKPLLDWKSKREK